MPLGLLIPLLAPVITELFKYLTELVISEVPAKAIPLVSTIVGAACVGASQLAGVDLGVSPIEGGVLGLAGTGVHQLKTQWVGEKEDQ